MQVGRIRSGRTICRRSQWAQEPCCSEQQVGRRASAFHPAVYPRLGGHCRAGRFGNNGQGTARGGPLLMGSSALQCSAQLGGPCVTTHAIAVVALGVALWTCRPAPAAAGCFPPAAGGVRSVATRRAGPAVLRHALVSLAGRCGSRSSGGSRQPWAAVRREVTCPAATTSSGPPASSARGP